MLVREYRTHGVPNRPVKAPLAPAAAFSRAVQREVARIPRGKLSTYGDIARRAGYPGRPRQVGMTLKALPEGSKLPWHRVVNALGYVPTRGRWWGVLEQIRLLRREGIAVDDDGRLNLAKHRWSPR
jgi:methylated-DNA-protein-cysteine methyltransferase-like protein